MALLAEVCNRYPNMELSFEADKDSYDDGDVAELNVKVSRADVEDEEELKVFASPVYAQYYPGVSD
jgi:NAD(P)H-dependent FMN reductase